MEKSKNGGKREKRGTGREEPKCWVDATSWGENSSKSKARVHFSSIGSGGKGETNNESKLWWGTRRKKRRKS